MDSRWVKPHTGLLHDSIKLPFFLLLTMFSLLFVLLYQVTETWLAYAPVKNNPEDAAKVPKGNPYHSATSGEMAIYRANSMILKKVSKVLNSW